MKRPRPNDLPALDAQLVALGLPSLLPHGTAGACLRALDELIQPPATRSLKGEIRHRFGDGAVRALENLLLILRLGDGPRMA